MINLTEEIATLVSKLRWGEEISDYGGDTYIDDAISEIADNYVDIYYSDLYQYLSEYPERVEETINEYGWEGCNKSLTEATQLTQYRLVNDYMQANLKKIMMLYSYRFLRNEKKLETITEERRDAIECICENADSICTFEEFEDKINKELKGLF